MSQDMEGYPFSQFKSVRAQLPLQSKLVSITEEESLAAEKFRFLAVRLRHLQQKHPFKRLLLTSSSARRRQKHNRGESGLYSG